MNPLHFRYAIVAIVGLGVAFTATSSATPLFPNTDTFVLFAQEELELEEGTQISSGDLGSNGEIEPGKDAIVNGNLYAKEIELEKNAVVNGNASFRKLKTKKDAQILGEQAKNVQLPIANISEIPVFSFGAQDITASGTTMTLAAGNYKDITLQKDATLTLEGGVYNLRSLELKDNAVLLFSATTTLNIQTKLRGRERVSVLPINAAPFDGLTINYIGIKQKGENDDDDMDEDEKKEFKQGKAGRPLLFGNRAFLSFKLNAPRASVKIGKESTVRGQIVAKRIKIGKRAILSREERFARESDDTKIIESGGTRFLANEIIVLLDETATFADAQSIADLVGGRITGSFLMPQIYKIEVTATTVTELNSLIDRISNASNPRVIAATRNFIMETF